MAAVPTESTFSRAFAAFAAAGTPTQIHKSLIKNTQLNRTFDYIARDSTAIEARERFPEVEGDNATPASNGKTKKRKPAGTKKTKPAAKSVKARRQPGKYGPNRRAKRSEHGTRIQRRHHMTLAAMLADLPRNCSLGVKKSSQGHQQYWRGYKLHWDVAAGRRIPISCVLTGVSVHDSQVAIPVI